MRKVARYVYVATAWLTLAWILVTIFLAGMALFVRTPYWELHKEIGWSSDLALLVLILAGLVGWIPRRLTAWLVALIVLHALHTSLPSLKPDVPLAAALHPVSATLLAWLSLAHARRAQRILLGPPVFGVPQPRATATAETG
jgi:hypothetical protein